MTEFEKTLTVKKFKNNLTVKKFENNLTVKKVEHQIFLWIGNVRKKIQSLNDYFSMKIWRLDKKILH